MGKGETASQRGEKGEEGLANMQLTSRLARFLESQVIRKLLRLHNLFQIVSMGHLNTSSRLALTNVI